MDYRGYTEYKQTHDCNHFDSIGWELIDIIMVEGCNTDRQNYYDQTRGGNVTDVKILPYKNPCFIWGRKENDTISAIRKELDEANDRYNKTHGLLNTAIDESKKFEAAYKERGTEMDVYALRLTKIQDALSQCQAQNKKFEQDIIKLRTALGELRMNEILGV